MSTLCNGLNADKLMKFQEEHDVDLPDVVQWDMKTLAGLLTLIEICNEDDIDKKEAYKKYREYLAEDSNRDMITVYFDVANHYIKEAGIPNFATIRVKKARNKYIKDRIKVEEKEEAVDIEKVLEDKAEENNDKQDG